MATTKATELSQLSSALQVDESTGEIIFTGSLSVDSNTLFIDADSNRVGIGTLTPGSALDVSGDVTVSGNVDGRNVSSDGSKLDTIESGADVTDTANVTSAGALMDSELTNESAIKNIDQELTTTSSVDFGGLDVDSGTLFVDSANGRVGVDVSGSETLSVYDSFGLYNKTVAATGDTLGAIKQYGRVSAGNDRRGAEIRFTAADSPNTQQPTDVFISTLRQRGSSESFGDALKIGHNRDISFYEDTGTTPKFFWDASAERLGIGTSSPDVKLDVQGSILSEHNGTGISLHDINAIDNDPNRWNDPENSSLKLDNRNQALSIIVGGVKNDRRAMIQVGHADSEFADELGDLWLNKLGGTVRTGDDLNVNGSITAHGLNTDGGDVSFTEDTGTTPKFFWDASAERLGIGTSSPQAKVDSSGVGNFETGFSSFTGDGLHIQCNGTQGNGNYAGGISFSRISTDNDSRAAGICAVQTKNDPDEVGLAFFIHPTPTTGADISEAARIDSNGSLLVGTTDANVFNKTSGEGVAINGDHIQIARDSSPPLTLNRQGSDGSTLGFNKDGSEVGRIAVYSNNLQVAATGSRGIIFDSGSSESMRIDSDGNVGIGTSSPSQPLHVNGDSKFGSNKKMSFAGSFNKTSSPKITLNVGSGSFPRIGFSLYILGRDSFSSNRTDYSSIYGVIRSGSANADLLYSTGGVTIASVSVSFSPPVLEITLNVNGDGYNKIEGYADIIENNREIDSITVSD